MASTSRTDADDRRLRSGVSRVSLQDFVIAVIANCSKSKTAMLLCLLMATLGSASLNYRSDAFDHRHSSDQLASILRCPVIFDVSLKRHVRPANISAKNGSDASTLPHQHSAETTSRPRCTCNRLLEIRCSGGLTSLPQSLSPVVHDGDNDEAIGYHHQNHQLRHRQPSYDTPIAWNSFHASGQSIDAIPSAAFVEIPVHRIVLNFNPIGNRIKHRAFQGVGLVLHELFIGACRIRTLRVDMLHGLAELRRLHMWSNEIDNIPQGFFGQSRNLHELVMWGNRIEEIDERTFSGLSRLQRLDLDRNRIHVINYKAFSAMPRLEMLRISGNRIHSINADTFSRLSNLKVLGLDRNGLAFVEPKAFSRTNHLLSVSLSGNAINILADDVFVGLHQLKVFRLADNHLKFIWARTFAGLQSVNILDLSGNRFVQLPAGTFRHMPQLAHLKLDRNRLLTLDRCAVINTGGDNDKAHDDSESSLSPLLDEQWSGFDPADDTSSGGVEGDYSSVRRTPTCFPSTSQSHVLRSRRYRLRTLSFTGNPIPCDCRVAWLLDDGEDLDVFRSPREGDTNGTSIDETGSCPEGWNSVPRRQRPVDVFWGVCSGSPVSLTSIVANDTDGCAETDKSCGK